MTSSNRGQPPDGTRNGDQEIAVRRQMPPFLTKLWFASSMYGLQSFVGTMHWLREWSESRNRPEGRPDIVKTYECRPNLPVRIFFPASYDQTSSTTLPTLFTIHGGGFCIGHSRDDDEWNRAFADTHHVLVISLNYRKAPAHPFPTAPHDVAALLLAALDDASLPIDRTSSPCIRTALLGFSAGGNLALSVAQLPSVRAHALYPTAVVSVYGPLDLSIPPEQKLSNRPYKPSLAKPRGDTTDGLIGLAPAFDWAYIPYGQDLCDPLLSPGFADRKKLPPFVGLVAAELDMLAHESWRFACRLSKEVNGNRVVPDRVGEEVEWRVCGNVKGEASVGKDGGLLIGVGEGVERDERFAFEESWEGGRGGVKWLLVPDVLHGFDNPNLRGLMGGGTETMEDAERKTVVYVAELARWLKEVVWQL